MSRQTDMQNLIDLNGNLEELVKKIGSYPWDSPELVELKPGHIVNALTRFMNNELSTSDIDEWANAIECRDDISISGPFADDLRQAVHELANPDLGYPLTHSTAKSMIEKFK